MSDDSNDILKTSSFLIKNLEKEKDIEVFSEIDPMLNLRKDILSFFQGIMTTVTSKEVIKKQIEDSFLEDLASGDLNLQDRMSLYKLISSQSNIAADSIISIFKPTPGAPSLLADNLSKERQEDFIDRIHESSKATDLQNIDKLMKALQILVEKGNQ